MTALPVVVDEPATRDAVAVAITDRAAANAALGEAVAAQQAAEGLIKKPDAITARIAALEQAGSRSIEQWAQAGGVGEPTLPCGEELGALREELEAASRLAVAARGALPALNAAITHLQTTSNAALAAIRAASVDVLEESAMELVGEITLLEKRAALKRGSLEGCRRALDMMAMRHRVVAAGTSAQRVRLACPGRPEPSEYVISDMTASWGAWADALVADANAQRDPMETIR